MTQRRVPQRIDQVTPGFYRFKLRRDGPWVPAQITLEEGMIFVVEADERLKIAIEASAYEKLVIDHVMLGDAFEHALLRVVWFGTLIGETEYRKMLDLITWAREHQPDHPCLHPDEPVRLREVKVSDVF
jgi:hypothetical protein